MLDSAIIGLGNIGFQLGLDPLRKETWSHAEAYTKCEQTRLVGAVEINRQKADLFANHFPQVPVYTSIQDLMANQTVELVSICTPMETHSTVLLELANYPSIKGIFCEKPIAASITEARDMVRVCANREIVLAVNHLKAWNYSYLHAESLVRGGQIGAVKAVNAYYPARMFNMGTHLFYSVFRITGLTPEKVCGVSFDLDSDDPTISGWISCKEGAVCTVGARGKREDFIFEIDVIGENGRMRLIEMEGKENIELYMYEQSPRYTDYRELFYKGITNINNRDMFVEALYDIANVLDGNKADVNCSGYDGLLSLYLCCAMLESAKTGSGPVTINSGNTPGGGYHFV